MSFLKSFLPAPFVDIFVPIALILLAVYVVKNYLFPPLRSKLEESGVWDQIIDRFGGEKYRQMQFTRKIANLKKKGDLVGAAQLYEDAEWYEEAIETYQEAEEYIPAGALYEKLEHYEHAAEMYRRADDWKRAANTLVAAGHGGKAAEIYEKNEQKIDAAKLYYDAGIFDRAAELYEQVSYHPQAAQAFEKMGKHLKAAENYEKHWLATSSFGGGGLISSPSDREAKVAMIAGQLYEKCDELEKAASIYQRARLSKKAAELSARMGNFDQAGELLLKEEELGKAAEMFEKAGQTERAAVIRGEVAFRQGDAAKAAEEFLKGRDNLRAAELFESVGDLVTAAKCYEQSESLLQAANVYLRAEKKQEAATMFERGGDALMAAKLYSEVGQESKASELFEKAGRFFEAGRLAHRQGEGERAIQLFQRVEPSDDNYETATVLLSRLFLDKNMVSLAQEKLQRVLRDRPIGPQTLEHYYCLGLVYEKLGKREEAIETFRKVMAERYGYEDVEEKIARLSAPASAAPVAPPAAPASAAPPIASASPAAAPRPLAAPAKPAPPAAPPPPTASTPTAPTAGAAPSPPFKLLEELGRGLLGGTFKAVDTRNGRPVVVKFLRKDILQNPEIVKRFLAEVKLARSFDQPNLVRLLGLTEMRGHKVVIMEFVEGRSLAAILSGDRRLNVKQAIDLLTNLCVALGYAHQRQVLHKDLKLTDVLVAKGGKLRLSGVGLGALRTPALGKGDGYAPPEFLAGNRVDVRTDIYSLGGLLFHGMTGLHPASPQAAANGASPTLQKLVPGIPVALDQIIAQCLAEEPDGRFRNVAELLAATHALKT
ncbi:MAG: protein kinase [Vicinamibacteria bacterium]